MKVFTLRTGRRQKARRITLYAVVLCAAVVGSSLSFFAARASNPTNGALTATAIAPVTWNGTAPGTPPAAAGDPNAAEAKCTEGTNCDTFLLTLDGTPADWAGKRARVKITWNSPSTDYDMVVRRDSATGPVLLTSGRGATSAAGTPLTEEEVVLDPAQVGTGVFAVRAVYYAASGALDQYRGSAAAEAVAAPPVVTYLKDGIGFSPSFTVRAPYIGQDVEPSTRVDQYGNAYVAAIRGLTGGNDLWYFDLRPTITTNVATGAQAPNPKYDPFMRNPLYRGQPDSFTEQTGDDPGVGADGGGDVDLAVSRRASIFEDPNDPPELAFTSLLLANISTQMSENRGVTFTKNPAGNATGGVPIDDRQWFESYGRNVVYLLYRTVAPTVTQIQRSTDHGLTFGPARTAGTIGQVGYIDVHQATGTVYVSGTTGMVCVGEPPTDPVTGQPLRDPVDPTIFAEPLTYRCNQAVPGIRNIFIPVKVADDGTPNGTAYAAYSNAQSVFVAYSKNKGVTWSTPVRVSDGPETQSSLLPWIETGPTPGSLAVVWYGTAGPNDNNSNWHMFYAFGQGVDTATPTFRQVKASDHVIHASNISTSGLSPTNPNVNRNLADYFQVDFDPTGAAVIAFTDDHNDFSGHSYVTRQISGPSIKGADVPTPVEGASLPARPVRRAGDPQVVDDRRDARTSTAVTQTEDPFDITSIRYNAESGPNGPVLVARMTVSDLTAVRPGIWRMNFTANAPDSTISPAGDYTFGVSDRGDQFWVAYRTDGATPTVRYGSAVRNGDGTITYLDRGAADGGGVDQVAKTFTVRLSLNKLTPFVKSGNPAVGPGSTLVGLRGQAFSAGASARTDATRGGTQYTIPAFPCATNFALQTLGSLATASSTFTSRNYSPLSAIDGDRTGRNWENGGGWNDNTRGVWPDTLDIDLGQIRSVNRVRVFTLQDNYKAGAEPTANTTALSHGIQDFQVQVFNGTSWVTVSTVTNNERALSELTFPEVFTSKVRLVVTRARANYTRIVELEALGCTE